MSSVTTKERLRPALFVGSILAASALVAGLIVFGAVACSSSDLRSGLGSDLPGTPEELLTELMEDREKIDKITDSMSDRVRAFNASRDPGEATLDFSQVFHGDLSGEERDVLNEMLASEQDLSYKALLQELIRERDTVQELQDRILRLEQTFPDQFAVAGRGDSQYQLAANYLTTQAGLDTAKAEELLGQIDMTDELIPGNRVWFFYDADRDAFRTYVTQGEAKMTPIELRRAQKASLIAERDDAQLRADALATDLDVTRAEKEREVAMLSAEVQELSDRRARLEMEVSSLESEVATLASDLARQKNSVFFHAAAERDLRRRGALSPVLKRFRDGSVVQYNKSLDLTRANSIRFEAASVGLTRIDKVEVLPSVYQAERDYVVLPSADGSEVTVKFLDPDIFRGKEVLFSLHG